MNDQLKDNIHHVITDRALVAGQRRLHLFADRVPVSKFGSIERERNPLSSRADRKIHSDTGIQEAISKALFLCSICRRWCFEGIFSKVSPKGRPLMGISLYSQIILPIVEKF